MCKSPDKAQISKTPNANGHAQNEKWTKYTDINHVITYTYTNK